MRFYLAVYLLFIACNYENRINGVVLDRQTMLPVRKAIASTLIDIRGRQLIIVSDTTGRNGQFELRFNTKQPPVEVRSIELKCKGYITNTYFCNSNNLLDTFFLKKEE